MNTKLVQRQEQKAVQRQHLTQQQIMYVRLLEMPLAEFEENVRMEMDDNPALEVDDNGDPALETSAGEGSYGEDVLWDGEDDGQEVRGARSEERGEMVWSDSLSFYDKLKEQMGELDLTAEERDVLEYIIGSLDDDGLLRKPLDSICDELAIYHNIDITEKDAKRILKILQGFDPAGIGAQSLRECLLIQIERREERLRVGERSSGMRGEVLELMKRVIEEYYDDFMQKRWGLIAERMNISEEQMADVCREILKLNPKPGASMGETMNRSIDEITPDFIVDTLDDGTITFSLNSGRVPELRVSESFNETLITNENEKMNKREKEALLYVRDKVERAKNYIEAIKQRRRTLYLTMKAIIEIQRKFFLDGDEADLKPMALKDIAERTGLDISTISRVSNEKYAQTRWGIFKLRFFFSEGVKTESGEALSNRRMKVVLKEIIDAEDKRKPLSDETIKKMMEERGYPIARRTVTKYREQLGIPVARLRS